MNEIATEIKERVLTPDDIGKITRGLTQHAMKGEGSKGCYGCPYFNVEKCSQTLAEDALNAISRLGDEMIIRNPIKDNRGNVISIYELIKQTNQNITSIQKVILETNDTCDKTYDFIRKDYIVIDSPIYKLGISVSAYNSLARHGFETIRDVINHYKERGLYGIRGLGKIRRNETINALKDFKFIE